MNRERREVELLQRALKCIGESSNKDLCGEIEVFLAQPEQWKPECCICKTNKNVEWVGGFQAYRCNSKECFPF